MPGAIDKDYLQEMWLVGNDSLHSTSSIQLLQLSIQQANQQAEIVIFQSKESKRQ